MLAEHFQAAFVARRFSTTWTRGRKVWSLAWARLHLP